MPTALNINDLQKVINNDSFSHHFTYETHYWQL